MAAVQCLADGVAGDERGRPPDSNGIWEVRQRRPLVSGDIGCWLVLDRALWIARAGGRSPDVAVGRRRGT